MDPIRMTDDFQWVLKVLRSCKTANQLSTARQLTACFFEKYKTEFDSISKAYTLQEFQQAMDDCVLGDTK